MLARGRGLLAAELMTRCHAPNCNQPATRKCAGCEVAYYCSPRCQRQDWPSHRRLCKMVTALLEEFQRVWSALGRMIDWMQDVNTVVYGRPKESIAEASPPAPAPAQTSGGQITS